MGKKKSIKKRKNIKSSKIEVVFGNWLKKNGFNITTQFKILNKYYDFKISDLPILIEFHGDYYHANPFLYESKSLNLMQIRNVVNDKYKKALAEKTGYKIFYVWESDFKKNKALVKKALLKFIGETI